MLFGFSPFLQLDPFLRMLLLAWQHEKRNICEKLWSGNVRLLVCWNFFIKLCEAFFLLVTWNFISISRCENFKFIRQVRRELTTKWVKKQWFISSSSRRLDLILEWFSSLSGMIFPDKTLYIQFSINIYRRVEKAFIFIQFKQFFTVEEGIKKLAGK